LPRIIGNKENIEKLLKAVDHPCNGITLCTGSLGSNPDNDLIDIIHTAKNRIPFAHVRNLKHTAPGKFEEAAHYTKDGSLDIIKILQALYDDGFDGVIRPDQGRAIWGEKSMPGYGLYDRALGASYLLGIWNTLERIKA
jgi:mannonate dehydratase